MDSKLISIINSLYIYFLISVYFWIYLIRGFLVYGIIPAFCSLILTIDDLSKGKGDEVAVLYKKYNKKFSIYKFQSFVISMFFIFLYSMLFLMNMYDNSIASITVVSLIFFLIIGAIFFTNYIHILSFKNLKTKPALVTSYILSIKYFANSFLIIVIIYLIFILAKTNLILFFVLTPFIFGKMTMIITKKCLNQI